MNRVGVMAYHQLEKETGLYALDIHAEKVPGSRGLLYPN